jgi:hypothetical protein
MITANVINNAKNHRFTLNLHLHRLIPTMLAWHRFSGRRWNGALAGLELNEFCYYHSAPPFSRTKTGDQT